MKKLQNKYMQELEHGDSNSEENSTEHGKKKL